MLTCCKLKQACKELSAKCKQKILRTQKITGISRLNIQNTRFDEVTNHNIWVSELSLNNGQKYRKPVFMRVSSICFIEWLWFGSICGRDKGCESTDGEMKA